MIAILLVGAIIHLPSMIYYASEEYSPDGKGHLDFALQGSAICTTREWVACQDASYCPASKWDETVEERDNYAVAPDGTILVLLNGCEVGDPVVGFLNLFGFFVLAFLVWLASQYLAARQIRFDADK